MRILLFSLLRLGDSLMHQQVRHAFKKKYPHARITWLMNDGNTQVSELFPAEDEVLFFPRKSFQDMAQLKTLPVGAPELTLNQWLQLLHSEQFDIAFNMGHDKISGYLMRVVNAKEKFGLQWDGEGWMPFENEWLSYLNENMNSNSHSEHHYCDLLLKIAG